MLFTKLFMLTCLQADPVLLDRTEAFVNKDLILTSDVSHFRRTLPLRAQLDPMFAGSTISARGSSATQGEVTAFLIDDSMISQTFPVSNSEVESEINNIQINNKIGRTQLKATLKEQGYEFSDYYDLIKSSLSKKSLIDREIRSRVFISDDDVKNYFYNHQVAKSGVGNYSYKIQIIRATVANYKSAAGAKETLQRASQAIRAGEVFSEIAKRFSDDPSATTGGELGVFTEDEMNPQIRSQVMKLKIGETSEVLGDEKSSFFIIRLADLKTGQEEKLEKSKEEIRNQLMVTEFQHQIQLWIERKRADSYIYIAK
ncbi:MAG: peptidylprolyl isomerase [Xanthomonadaceae bacterium]|nr:peptidylprolyl isomerase [Xanthomonadaceae bacterium]